MLCTIPFMDSNTDNLNVIKLLKNTLDFTNIAIEYMANSSK